MTHPKYERVRDAINDLHGDTTVDREVTRDALENLAADIDGILMCMNEEDQADD